MMILHFDKLGHFQKLGGSVAKSVEYFRTYNENKFTGNITAWKSYNETVPENYKIKYSTHNKYSGGWNYWSHEVSFHWTAGGK